MKKENTSAFLRGLKVCKTLVILGIGFAGTRAHYNIFKASERAYTSGVACGTSERFIDADSGRCQALPKDYLCKPGTDSGGTCYVMNCFDWRGDTECSWGSCICKNTDCVVAGRCIDCADYDCVTSQMVKCYKINTNIWGEPEDCNLNSEGICEVEMSGTGWFSGDGEDPSGELVSGAICTDPLTVSCQIWVLNSNDDPLSKMGSRKGVNLGANLGTIRGVQSFEANFFKKPSHPLDDSCGIVNGEIQMALVYPLDKDEGYDIPPVPAAAIYAIYKLFALHPQGLGFVLSCCIPGGTLELLLRTFPCWTWLSLKIQPVAAYIKYTVIPTLMIEPLLSIKEVEGVSADRMVLSRVASYEANTVLYFYVGVHLFLLLVFTFLFACCELRVKGGHKCCAAAIEAIKAEAEKASDADVQEDPKSSDVEKAGNDTENLESDAKNAENLESDAKMADEEWPEPQWETLGYVGKSLLFFLSLADLVNVGLTGFVVYYQIKQRSITFGLMFVAAFQVSALPMVDIIQILSVLMLLLDLVDKVIRCCERVEKVNDATVTANSIETVEPNPIETIQVTTPTTTVTFEPGPLGFNQQDGVVLTVSEHGQARRNGVQPGWRIKAVRDEACARFEDPVLVNAKSGNVPYQVTFWGSQTATTTVTFEPGPLGFNHQDGVVLTVSEDGQARRNGVQPGWRIKAVRDEACARFEDSVLVKAKSGNVPYQVTFWGSQAASGV